MFRRKWLTQGETILKPAGPAASKLHLAKLHYVTNVYTNFQKHRSKTVGGVRDTKLLVFCTRHTDADRQADSSIPPKTIHSVRGITS